MHQIREARRQSGWTQRVLAERAGVSAQALKRLEKGIGSTRTLMAVMQALDFRLTGLSSGDSLGEQLRIQRKKRGWSLDRLSERTSLSRTTIAELERGRGTVASLERLLAVVAPKLKRRAPERAYWGEGQKEDRDSRFTPPEFMAHIYEAFGPVDLDPCSHEASPVLARRYIRLADGGDGLAEPWDGDLVYVNPPYSRLLVWLRRAYEQWRTGNARTVVCLVPVRTDSALFQEVLSLDADIFLLKGRVPFLDLSGRRQHTPFSLMLVTLGATIEQKARLARLVAGIWMTSADDGALNSFRSKHPGNAVRE